MISGRGQLKFFSRASRALLFYTQPPLSINPGYAPGLGVKRKLTGNEVNSAKRVELAVVKEKKRSISHCLS